MIYVATPTLLMTSELFYDDLNFANKKKKYEVLDPSG